MLWIYIYLYVCCVLDMDVQQLLLYVQQLYICMEFFPMVYRLLYVYALYVHSVVLMCNVLVLQ